MKTKMGMISHKTVKIIKNTKSKSKFIMMIRVDIVLLNTNVAQASISKYQINKNKIKSDNHNRSHLFVVSRMC